MPNLYISLGYEVKNKCTLMNLEHVNSYENLILDTMMSLKHYTSKVLKQKTKSI